jgi:hypothetical protein
MAVLIGGCSATPSHAIPSCPPALNGDPLLLIAQSVPSATFVPCIGEFPVGWSFGGQRIETGHAEFWLGSDRAGDRAVSVILTGACDVSDAVQVPIEADEVGLERFEEPTALPPNFAGNRYYLFEGGCITYRFAFERGGSYSLVVEATEALSFVARQLGIEALEEEGLVLCGAGADCPG